MERLVCKSVHVLGKCKLVSVICVNCLYQQLSKAEDFGLFVCLIVCTYSIYSREGSSRVSQFVLLLISYFCENRLKLKTNLQVKNYNCYDFEFDMILIERIQVFFKLRNLNFSLNLIFKLHFQRNKPPYPQSDTINICFYKCPFNSVYKYLSAVLKFP